MIFIKIKTQFEGYHRYPNAPKEVAFLRSLHRHDFYVVTLIEVKELNREIEYFICKRVIDKLLKEIKVECASCEAMASILLKELELKYKGRLIQVEINEDNHNGSIVNNFPLIQIHERT